MRTVIALLLTVAFVSVALSQTLVGTCSPGQAWGTRVNSDFSVNLYCFTPPSGGCSNSLDFSQACNSQFIGAL